MSDDSIIKIIEKTLEEKMYKDDEYIRYTFYEIRVKYNLSEFRKSIHLSIKKYTLIMG